MTEYRVIKVTEGTGAVHYEVERKYWFFWTYWFVETQFNCYTDGTAAGDDIIKFDTEFKARQYIRSMVKPKREII